MSHNVEDDACHDVLAADKRLLPDARQEEGSLKSITEMRSAMQLDAAINYACQMSGKSRRHLCPSDFRIAAQRAARTDQRALVQPLERLAIFGELVDAMREADGGSCVPEQRLGPGG